MLRHRLEFRRNLPTRKSWKDFCRLWASAHIYMLEHRKEQKCSVYPFYKNFPLPDSNLNSRISYLSFHRKACWCSPSEVWPMLCSHIKYSDIACIAWAFVLLSYSPLMRRPLPESGSTVFRKTSQKSTWHYKVIHANIMESLRAIGSLKTEQYSEQ